MGYLENKLEEIINLKILVIVAAFLFFVLVLILSGNFRSAIDAGRALYSLIASALNLAPWIAIIAVLGRLIVYFRRGFK